MSIVLSDQDLAWIDSAKNDPAKVIRRTALTNLLEMNGIKFESGLGKSYIPERNYYQLVNIEGLTGSPADLLEIALNFDALGGGIGALAGAAVRHSLKKLFIRERETTVISRYLDEYDEVIERYSTFCATRRDVVPFWGAQANNVLGLAGAVFNREMHHWDASNTKPQMALLGALGQADAMPESEFRKLFYLSIHPVPLAAMEDLRATIAAGKVAGINDAVATRCRAAPAGCGDIHASSQAIPDLRAEPFYDKFGARLKDQLNALEAMNTVIIEQASTYHAFASAYGKERKFVDKGNFKRAMNCAIAYIIVNIKGSLAQSAALRKYRNANARTIQRWISAFETANSNLVNDVATLGAD